MAIDLGLKRHLVFFEIDNSSPHDLSRFHRIISQSIAMGKIATDDFEEVIGSYEGKMNVAYCLSIGAWQVLSSVIWRYMLAQREVYVYDMDTMSLVRVTYAPYEAVWALVSHDTAGWSAGNSAPDAPGWTYFPSSGLYFTIDIEEAV